MSTFERWRAEKESAWMYRAIVGGEHDLPKARLFELLAQAAEQQAAILERDLVREHAPPAEFRPSLRARAVAALTRRIGPKRARPLLAALKVRGLSVYSSRTFGHAMPLSAEEVGARHRRAGGGGNLRAAVFGVNDGLVSNTGLVLGVAGADADTRTLLMTGLAGLLAGAFSMAAGEYVSMRSQRELFEHQIGEEREELERYPDEEAEELALIYEARGVPIEEARALARRMLQDKERMLDTLAREELGLNPDDLGSPWGAALASFVAFAIGASAPLLPFVLRVGDRPLVQVTALAAFALFAIGAVLSLFSGRSASSGGLRMLLVGGGVGLATYGIGRVIGAYAGG